MDLKGKQVLVFGAGRSGVGAATLLLERGALPVLYDGNEKLTQEKVREQFPDGGKDVRIVIGELTDELIASSDLCVISPGVPTDIPPVCRIREAGVKIWGEVELAWQCSKGQVLAVTGTNGKTTTVTLLGDLMKKFIGEKNTHVVGNIGYPFSLAALISRKEDILVCEVSSFQMETADTFHPHVALLTNITEDHLNRHGTMEVYTAMKMRMFRNQTAQDFAVFNADDPALEGLSRQVRSKVLEFSRKKEVKNGAFVRNGEIWFAMNGSERRVCRTEEIFIPGPHNLENALGAVCVAAAMNVPAPVIRHSLKTFRGVEHRIESVRELDGIEYINDSKGTNPDSTIKAVQTMSQPTVIILGGYDKHASFDALSREIVNSPMIRQVVVIGETAGLIRNSLERAGFSSITEAGTLREAVEKARDLADKGWSVLLSPACASFDMFKDYEERGRVFKEIVHNL